MRRRPPSAIRLPLALVLLAAPALAEPVADLAAAPVDGGAQVSVQVDAKGDTTLEVKRGSVKVRSGGREARVGAGETVRAHKGKPLSRVLGVVTPTAPADGATVGKVDVALAWQKLPGAAKYLVEVSAAPELSAAQTQTVDGTKTVVHLAPGTWYWRVTALDAGGAPGKRGLVRRLTIDTTPPKLKTGKPEWR